MSSGILYSSNLNYPDGELRKNGFQDFAVDLNPYNHHHHQQQQQQLQQGSNHSGLARLRSAPSSFFGDLVNGGVGGGFDDFRYFRPSSPDMDAIFSRLLSPTSNGNPDPLLIPASAAPESQQGFVKQEAMDSSFQQNLGNESSGEWKDHHHGGGDSAAPTFMDSIDLGSSVASAAANSNSNNGSNLARHNSSPAGLFSSLVVENVFHGIGEVSQSPRNSNSTSSRLSSSRTTSFSASAPRLLPQISEIGEDTFKSPNSGKRLSSSDAWDFATMGGMKRLKQDNDGDDLDFFSTLNAMDNNNLQQQNGGNRLSHHLSLPKTAAEMASVEKFLQLQGSVPCKIRAKRGFATHPRSIAERVRRTKISERMRKLQDLFPKTDKTNTAEMLDLAVEYIKDLQKQVKIMKDTKASCTCLREHKA